jgi:hypothetical protein
MERRLLTILVVLAAGCLFACGKAPEAAPAKPAALKAAPTATPAPIDDAPVTAEGLNPKAFPDDELRAALWKLRYPDQAGGAVTVAEGKPPEVALAHLIKATTVACSQHCPNIRAQAARILLGWKNPPASVEAALLAFLQSERDDDVLATVVSSIDAFKPAGDEISKLLLGFLEGHDDKMVRAYSAVALGVFDYQVAKPALIKALEDPESWVRLMALQGLRKLNARDALPAVKKLLNDPNVRVKERAREVTRALGG